MQGSLNNQFIKYLMQLVSQWHLECHRNMLEINDAFPKKLVGLEYKESLA